MATREHDPREEVMLMEYFCPSCGADVFDPCEPSYFEEGEICVACTDAAYADYSPLN
jgi:hypothetical protein